MKKTYLLFFMLVISIVAMAKVVTPDEARQRISKFMNPRRAGAIYQNPSALQLVATSHYETQTGKAAPCYYVFNIGESEGYVIASADDRIPEVLGYSAKGQFSLDNMPVNMKSWLQSYSDQMAYLDRHPEAAAPRRTVAGDPISPLIASQWDQTAPYNDLCPLDGTQRSLSGCVATALAQVMYYHKYPAATTATVPGYTTRKKKFVLPDIPAGTPIDWDNILPSYNGSETDAQKEAIANLMLLCGTIVQMNYSATFSGANGVDAIFGLLNYLDYDISTTHESHSYYRVEEWNQKVYNELAANRPVYYEGSSSSTGHAFVIDGYGGDDYFHVNWGWGGADDGYFLLSILNPYNNTAAGANSSSDGYSFEQGAIFGARPNTGAPASDIVMTTHAMDLPEGNVYKRKSVNEGFTLPLGFSYINETNSTHTFEFGIGAFTLDGQFIDIVAGERDELPSKMGYFTPGVFTIQSLAKGLTNMAFKLMPMSHDINDPYWHLNRGYDIYNATVFVGDTIMEVYGATFGLEGQFAAEGKKEVGIPLPITATVTNKGTAYLGEIFLVVDGMMVGGRHFDINAGETKKVDISFIPEYARKCEVSLCTRKIIGEDYYEYTPFIKDSITVEPGAVANLTILGNIENAQNAIVSENNIQLKVSVTNNGPAIYDNQIQVILFKDQHTDGSMFDLMKTVAQAVQLESGQSTDFIFNFENLEDDYYALVVAYFSEGIWKWGYQSTIHAVNSGYYLISDLNSWSPTDKSYPFTRQDDGKTWELTFAGADRDIWLKIVPSAAFNYQNNDLFWERLLCTEKDSNTDLQGKMVDGNKGAWLLPKSLNAESFTMRIVPTEMTYEITYKEKTDGIVTMESQQKPVTVYSLDGNKQTETSGQTLQQVIKSLPKGVYIIRSGQQTKVIRH